MGYTYSCGDTSSSLRPMGIAERDAEVLLSKVKFEYGWSDFAGVEFVSHPQKFGVVDMVLPLSNCTHSTHVGIAQMCTQPFTFGSCTFARACGILARLLCDVGHTKQPSYCEMVQPCLRRQQIIQCINCLQVHQAAASAARHIPGREEEFHSCNK